MYLTIKHICGNFYCLRTKQRQVILCIQNQSGDRKISDSWFQVYSSTTWVNFTSSQR